MRFNALKHTVLSMDFAFRNTGWVVIDKAKLIQAGNIITEAMKTKDKKAKPTEEWIRYELTNARYISSAIESIVEEHEPDFVVAEIPFFSQKANDAILIGLGWQLLAQFQFQLVTGGKIKELLCGKRTATKTEIQRQVDADIGPFDPSLQMLDNSHKVDAYATYMAWATPEMQDEIELTKTT